MKKRKKLEFALPYEGKNVYFERTTRRCIICQKMIWHYFRTDRDLKIYIFKNMFFCKKCWRKSDVFDVDETFNECVDLTELDEESNYAPEKDY